mgnify:CR=1 FL=1
MTIFPVYKPHKDRIARLASAKKAIAAISKLDLYPAHKKELLSVCIWKITEADGKFNLRYWSEGALSASKSELRHEHVYERKELIERLMRGENVDVISALAIACVVTRAEHSRLSALPESVQTGWERYREAGVRVYDVAKGSEYLIDA